MGAVLLDRQRQSVGARRLRIALTELFEGRNIDHDPVSFDWSGGAGEGQRARLVDCPLRWRRRRDLDRSSSVGRPS
ncbi:hypothetical protein BWI15_32550 [Kribbella sp. ALI-6-A]|nr:hypothetical protein BWI15_32550 [Kribbella sp. ALI-6-A]